MTTDIQDNSPRAKAQANYDRFLYAKERGHDDFIEKYDLCDDFFFSDQWADKDKRKLAKSERPYLTINKIKSIILHLMGEYLNNRMEVKFVPTSAGTPDTAEALTKLFIHISNNQKLNYQEQIMVLEAFISSRGYFDVRMDFDDNFKGEVIISTPNSKNVIPDPDADGYNPDDWNDVTIVSYQTIQDLQINYGKEKAEKAKHSGAITRREAAPEFDEQDSFGGKEELSHQFIEGDGSDPERRSLFFVIERQYKAIEKVPFFVHAETGEVTRVPADWNKDMIDERLAENQSLAVEEKEAQVIRWTVSTGSVLLHDSLSPYDHFTIIPYFPIFKRGRTAGPVEDLIDPQRNYNKLRSQELHIVNGTSNSGWKVKHGALKNMRVQQLEEEGSKTGLVIEYDGDSDSIERIDPVQIPTGLDRISQKADSDLGDVSGIQDETRGVARADVSGKAIANRRQAAMPSFSTFLENLEQTREMLADRVLKLVQRYYDDERRIYITTGGLRAETQEVALNTPDENGEIVNDLTVGEYQVTVVPTAARDSFENEQFAELERLATLGVPVPTYLFVEYSSLDRKEEISQEMRQAAGTDTPSEEERELAQKEKQIALRERMAGALAREAQARLSEARAKKVLSEIQSGELDEAKANELLLKARELDIQSKQNEDSMEVRKRAQRLQEIETLLEDDRALEQLRIAANKEKDDAKEDNTEDRRTAGSGVSGGGRRSSTETGGGGGEG